LELFGKNENLEETELKFLIDYLKTKNLFNE